ncbi:hypothetical protein JK358_34160 [Nocardia sp. 2]|uniref:Heavy-metal chelation domain-containing protein n=1 Tax=Nocardia acididurans TaxID=2802282 RepID=A0ABS1MFX0_9NOCA|nr:hypothetical protein [Nocardia acididurans]
MVSWVSGARVGPDPAEVPVASAFLTVHGTRHAGRAQSYRNVVLSVRVGSAVGSCAIEPGELPVHLGAVDECVGVSVAELLVNPLAAVRLAALDAYLMQVRPHAGHGTPVRITGEDSLVKSRQRARSVIDLLPPGTRMVLVIGVVNSLLAELRDRGIGYVPCDRAGGVTEWGEPVRTSAELVREPYDALLVTGMTVGTNSFDPLLTQARERGLPLVMFAQTASAVLPWFVGAPGVTALSAEPYPFFSLDGGPSTLFHYRSEFVCSA